MNGAKKKEKIDIEVQFLDTGTFSPVFAAVSVDLPHIWSQKINGRCPHLTAGVTSLCPLPVPFLTSQRATQ